MSFHLLVLRGLTYHWRTNLAVVAGVATAVAVLAGALLVGDSVRGSLRDLVLQRLGRTDHVVVSTGFFREQLALGSRGTIPRSRPPSTGVAPLVVVQGFVSDQESGRRAGQVRVYGVDDRFWRFHGVTAVTGPGGLDAHAQPGAGGGARRASWRDHPDPCPATAGHSARIGARPQGRRRSDAAAGCAGRSSHRSRWATLRSTRSRATCARCSCRSRCCRRSSNAAAASMRCSSRRGRSRRPTARAISWRDWSGTRWSWRTSASGCAALDSGGVSVESDAGLLTDEQVKAAQSALTAGRRRHDAGVHLPGEHAPPRRSRDSVLARDGDGCRLPTRMRDGIVLTEWAAH